MTIPWVSVNERLPELEHDVLATNGEECWRDYMIDAGFDEPVWGNAPRWGDVVTHWVEFEHVVPTIRAAAEVAAEDEAARLEGVIDRLRAENARLSEMVRRYVPEWEAALEEDHRA